MMEKVVTISRSFEEADRNEKKYYQALTPNERLGILFELNRLFPGDHDGEGSTRIEKVCRIIDRP